MQRFVSFRARSAVLGVAVVALSACDDHTDPNSPSARLNTQDVRPRATSPSLSAFAITDLTLSNTTLVIDGPSATYTARIETSTQSFKGLIVRAYFVQQQVRHQVGEQGVPCGFGGRICTYTNFIQASGLLPGAAVFELQLFSATGSLLSTRDVPIMLRAGQTISALSLSSNNLVIGGPSASYTATLQNQAGPRSGVAVEGWLVQSGANNARRSTGAIVVQCGSGSGILPNGACTVSNVIIASNSNPGTGTLTPGAATFELDLTVNGTVVALDSVPVSITSAATITDVRLAATSDTVLLEGASASYTTALQNSGASISGVTIQGFISQAKARRFATGTLVSCGSTSGTLPNGGCKFPAQLTATNNSAGFGTLVTGPATFELQLVDATGAVLSTATLPLFIVDGPLESGPPGPGTNSIVGMRSGRIRTP